MSKRDASRSLIGGVLVLGAGNLLVKVIGLVFKIPLSRLLGDLGMGYFNTGYTVYSWLFLVGCTGFPVAVSMLVSEAVEGDEGESGARRVLFRSLLFLFGLGAVGCLFLSAFADRVASRIGNPGSAAAIAAIAPAVLFCSLSGGIRGYFQGKKRMGPTAVSQLTEAAFKLILGIVFAKRALLRGFALPAVAAAAIRGVTVGTLASTVYLFLELFFDARKAPNKYKGRKEGSSLSLSRRLIRIALPVTVSATVMSVTGLIDLLFLMKRLVVSGYGVEEATALFGNYTTLAVPFFNLPGILISPIATGIVPFVSGDLSRGDEKRAGERCRAAIRSAVVISFPAALALGLFGERILSLFFLRSSAALAAPSLAVLSPGIVFLSLVTVSSAILQARGRAGVTVYSMLIGAIVKTVVGYILLGLPGVGVYGAAIGTVLCYAVVAIINLTVLAVMGTRPFGLSDLTRPILPSALSFALAFLLLPILPDRTSVFATLFLLALAGLLYFPLSVLFGSVTRNDAEMIPFLKKMLARFRSPERAK